MRYFITRMASFIGSNLADRLLSSDGHHVTGYDHFSTGQEQFIASTQINENFNLVRGDVLDLPVLTKAMRGAGFVLHLLLMQM